MAEQNSATAEEPSPDPPGWRAGGEFWGALNPLLSRGTALSPAIEGARSSATQEFLRNGCRVLIIGAGGLGGGDVFVVDGSENWFA